MKKTKEIGGNDSSWSNVGRCPRFKDAVDHSPPDLARDQFQVMHLSDRKKNCDERICSGSTLPFSSTAKN